MKLLEEVGEYYLSTYGSTQAFGFRGDDKFLDKTLNLCNNYGIMTGAAHKFSDNFHYVLTDKENLEKGIKEYFISEIIVNKEIPLLKDGYDENDELVVEYDESKINELATERTQTFMSKIVDLAFMSSYYRNDGFMEAYKYIQFVVDDAEAEENLSRITEKKVELPVEIN